MNSNGKSTATPSELRSPGKPTLSVFFITTANPDEVRNVLDRAGIDYVEGVIKPTHELEEFETKMNEDHNG